MISYKGKVFYCPFELSIDIISGKWKPLIIYKMFKEGGTIRFNELKRIIPDISSKVLSEKLREMEHDNLVRRDIKSTAPVRIDYVLTEHSLALMPILEHLKEWGEYFHRNVLHGEEAELSSCGEKATYSA